MTLQDVVLLAHIAATWCMVGIIWFVQVVHYPLFARVGRMQAADYYTRHSRLTGLVVAPPMLVEVATGVLLLWWRPGGVPEESVWLGLLLLFVIWLSTGCLQVPQHGVLAAGFDARAYRRLVGSNWVRTVTWSLRGLLVLGMVNS